MSSTEHVSTHEGMSPSEYAALVRDANTLVNTVETGIRRTGLLFVTASAVTIAALVLGWTPIAEVVSVVAVLGFAVALILVITRIYLGEVPEPLAEGSPAPPEVAQVANRPATGSASATPENRVISTK